MKILASSIAKPPVSPSPVSTPPVSVPPVSEIPVKSVTITGEEVEENIPMQVGKDIRLKSYYLPQNATNVQIKWSTDNPDIATVTYDGLLHACSTGETYVNLNVNGIWASKKVIVKKESQTPIDNAYFDTPIIVLDADGEGFDARTSLNIEPHNADIYSIEWYSEDWRIADVDTDGWITPYSAGTTTIFADIAGAGSDISALLNVTVQPTPIDVDAAYFGPPVIVLQEDDEGYYARPTLNFEPWNADIYSIEWYSEDWHIANVNEEGWITPRTPGTTTIHANVEGARYNVSTELQVIVEPAVNLSVDVDTAYFDTPVVALEQDGGGFNARSILNIEPLDAEIYSIDWYSDDNYIAEVDGDGWITPFASGSTNVFAIVEGVDTTITVPLRVDVQATEDVGNWFSIEMPDGDTYYANLDGYLEVPFYVTVPTADQYSFVLNWNGISDMPITLVGGEDTSIEIPLDAEENHFTVSLSTDHFAFEEGTYFFDACVVSYESGGICVLAETPFSVIAQ